MKIERTKNAARNIVFGSALKVYQIIVPFLMRTAMLYFMGVKYLGLNSLFTSVLEVLNLAELGVGGAMVYSMYKPIVEDDSVTICALMKLYRLYYRIIGFVILIAGILLLPFIPVLINDRVPEDINIYVLYMLNLMCTVVSYWLFAYKNCLLTAHQRVDITSKVRLITNTLQYLLQFFVIYFFGNYYAYVIVLLTTQILTNIVTAIVVTHKYPEYQARGQLDKSVIQQINRRIRDLFTSKIGAVIVNSVDAIVISAFLGLTVLAVYQNYFYILNSIIGFVAIIFNSCTAGIGNSIIVETKEKNYQDLKKFTFLVAWIAGFCTCCLMALYQPFMELWVGDKLKLKYSAVICLGIYYFIYEINHLLNTYKDAGGIWHKDRFRPLVTAMTNLIMNLIMVQFWGIYGVILSTVLSMIMVGMPWIIHNLFSTLFDRMNMYDYVKNLFLYLWNAAMACALTVGVSLLTSFTIKGKIATILVRMVICVIIPNVVFIVSYRKKKEFYECIMFVEKMTKGRLKLSLIKKVIMR